MYHDLHIEDGATSGDSRMIFTESMPRRVGSFYRGEEQDSRDETVCIFDTCMSKTVDSVACSIWSQQGN